MAVIQVIGRHSVAQHREQVRDKTLLTYIDMKILDQLAQAKVYIEYMYAFSDGEKASVAIKPDDMNAALDTLAKNGVEMI